MVTKPTGGPRGRRPLALRNDPERYAIAYFVARQSGTLRQYGGSPRALAKNVMQARHGIIDTAEMRAEAEEALLDGRDFRINMKKLNGRNDAENKRWQDRDSANALADNFCKKVRKLLKKLRNPSDAEDKKDADWLTWMVDAWQIAIGVYSYRGDPFAAALALATKAGESDHFWDVIAPQFVAFSFCRAPEEERSSLLARFESE